MPPGVWGASGSHVRARGSVVAAGGEQLALVGTRLTVDDGGKWSVFSNEHYGEYRRRIVARPADSLRGLLDKLPSAVDVLDRVFRRPHPNAAQNKLNLEL